MSKVYSAEYIDGIRSGRELLKQSQPDLGMMREYLASTIATMREFSSGPVKDQLRGERDFWRNQIKREILQRAQCLDRGAGDNRKATG